MQATMGEHTVLPRRHSDRFSGVLAALNETSEDRAPALLGRDGRRVELPDELFDVLKSVTTALANGLAITVAPQHTVLTTSEAAHLLGVSRPTVVRMLESGEIPYEQPGKHRRVRLADVLAHQERRNRARAAGLDTMVRESEEDGIYDVDPSATENPGSSAER